MNCSCSSHNNASNYPSRVDLLFVRFSVNRDTQCSRLHNISPLTRRVLEAFATDLCCCCWIYESKFQLFSFLADFYFASKLLVGLVRSSTLSDVLACWRKEKEKDFSLHLLSSSFTSARATDFFPCPTTTAKHRMECSQRETCKQRDLHGRKVNKKTAMEKKEIFIYFSSIAFLPISFPRVQSLCAN